MYRRVRLLLDSARDRREYLHDEHNGAVAHIHNDDHRDNLHGTNDHGHYDNQHHNNSDDDHDTTRSVVQS